MEPLSHATEQVLIDRITHHDAHAVEELVRRYSAVMLAAARNIIGRAEAEDVVQDAWISALESLKKFEGRASLKTWLLRIVTNKSISRLRGMREITMGKLADEPEDDMDWFTPAGQWKTAPLLWQHDSPEALLTTMALQKCVDAHLARMAENQRTAVVLRDMHGMELQEVADVLGVSAINLRVLIHRGRLKLMSMVNHFEETGEC